MKLIKNNIMRIVHYLMQLSQEGSRSFYYAHEMIKAQRNMETACCQAREIVSRKHLL